MLLLLTIALVVVGAVSLLIGFVNDQMFPIYLSIGCSVLAAVVLLVFSRLSRTRLEPAARPATSGAATTAVRTQTAAAPSSFSAADDDVFPIADYDDLRVSEILPLLPELDLDELETVREREESGRARASILRRLDELADELEAPAPAAVAAGSARDDDDLFPIEDYDDLRAGEILPLLDELEPDELEDVAARERSGAARASILDRIDVRLGREPEPVTIAASRAGSGTKKAVKKTAAKKTAAKKAPAKKAAPTKAPAKKAAAKKATSSAKAAGGAAKKATGGAKKAAKKATGSTKKG